MPQPHLQVVLASTRPGRVGAPVCDWVMERAVESGLFEVELVDLAEVGLPFMDEPNHPRLRNYQHDHTKQWSARVDSADAFVFVTPEYNYGINAPLKNAMDYLYAEWHYKPLGIVSYGGVSGGTRSSAMIKQVASSVKLVPTTEAVPIPFVQQFLTEGRLVPTKVMEESLRALLDEIAKLAAVLGPLRD